MKLRHILSLSFVLLAAVLLVCLFMQARPVDLEAHGKLVFQLQAMKTKEADWRQALMRSRVDLRQAEDGLLARLDELETARVRCAALNTDVGSEADQVLETRFESYATALRLERELAGQYSSLNAVLKQEWQLLPQMIEAFGHSAPKAWREVSTRAQVEGLLGRLLLFDLVSDGEPGADVRARLAKLKVAAKTSKGEEADAFDTLFQYLEALLSQEAEIEALLARMNAIPLGKRSQEILEAVNGRLNQQLSDSDLYRQCLYACALLMLAKLLHSMLALKRSARALHLAKQTLEQRVTERTELLSRTNTELEAEIQERKRAETESQRARLAAEAANRTKSAFLANMSHEIRTPMTAIVGFSEHLMDAGVSAAEHTESIASIRRNGDYLLQLINDILDLSKIEAGKLEIERIVCSPLELVGEVRNAIGQRAANKGLDFRIEVLGPIPSTVSTDPVRLKQVLLNLVGNAIKFTDKGRVTLAMHFDDALAAGDVTHGARLVFSVSDSGIGMSEDQVQRLFQPFTQADSSTTRMFGGTGLGLSISKHLVEAMGGTIAVDSSPGDGSTFRFEVATGSLEGVQLVQPSQLPAFITDPNGSAPQGVHPLSCSVLLVEDGVDNQRLITYLLQQAGARVTCAENGAIGIERVLAAASGGEPFDVVLMDMQMPVLDGYAATRKLRALGQTLPIVALTAHAMATDRAKCIEAGCDEFCTKPLDRPSLLATLGRLSVHAPLPTASTRVLPAARITLESRPSAYEPDTSPAMLELVRMFLDDLAQDLDAMHAAFVARDLDELARLAHRLKGTAGSYGFPDVTTQAARVESAVRSAQAHASIEQALVALDEACRRARASQPAHGV